MSASSTYSPARLRGLACLVLLLLVSCQSTPSTSRPTQSPTIAAPRAASATASLQVTSLPEVSDTHLASTATSIPPSATYTPLPAATSTSTPTPISQLWTAANEQEIRQLAMLNANPVGRFYNTVWAPDGQHLAVTGPLGVAYYDAQTLEMVWMLPYSSYAPDLSFSGFLAK